MEADFKFNNEILERDLMKYSKRNRNVPKEKYGSRKGRKAIFNTVNKQLLYDVIHLQWKPAILCSTDIKYFY